MEDSAHGFFHWNELITNDVEKAKSFFATVLGWSFDDMQMPDGGTYYVAMKDDEPVCGLMGISAEMPADTAPFWMSYIEVDDVAQSVEAVRAAGGAVLKAPFDVEEVGMLAVVKDPTGAVIGLMTPMIYEEDDA